jgi:quercetin dioxygenase-like cupin family protein
MAESDAMRIALDEATTVFVAGSETGGRLALLEVRVGRDSAVPLHRHHWEDEIIYVLEGDVLFYLDGERRPCSAGNCVLLPRGSEHSYAVESNEARLLVIVAPAGLEQLYKEQSDPRTRSMSTLEWLVTTGAKYGIEVTGPPPLPLRRNGHCHDDALDGNSVAPVGGGEPDGN